MRNEFTAIVEREGSWFIASCAEVPGANGQGKTRPECLANLREAISLILEHRREDSLRTVPPDAEQEAVCCAEGKEHSVWQNPLTGHAEAIPRHTEIANLRAKRICRKLSISNPPG